MHKFPQERKACRSFTELKNAGAGQGLHNNMRTQRLNANQCANVFILAKMLKLYIVDMRT